MNRDAEHIRLITLVNEIEQLLLKSKICTDEFELAKNDQLLPDFRTNIEKLGQNLTELGGFLRKDYSGAKKRDYPVIMQKYEDLVEKYSLVNKRIQEENFHSPTGFSPGIAEAFASMIDSFSNFRSFMPPYLLKDRRKFRTEIILVTLLNSLLILLSGFVILLLIKRVSETERKLVLSTIEVENRERERIAADLHDSLGAILSALLIHIQILRKEAKENDALQIKLQHLGDLSRDALKGIEETINNLNPSMLSRHGLRGSLQRLLKRMNELEKTRFTMETVLLPDELDKGTELLLYRICSELINNTLKHSGADIAVLQIEADYKNIRLNYFDDGKGFEYNKEMIEARKSGINNIYHRVESMDGKCSITTSPGRGIDVKISLPLLNG